MDGLGFGRLGFWMCVSGGEPGRSRGRATVAGSGPWVFVCELGDGYSRLEPRLDLVEAVVVHRGDATEDHLLPQVRQADVLVAQQPSSDGADFGEGHPHRAAPHGASVT